MTSSNWNIFRVTGPLCGEFTDPGEFPTQKPMTRSFDVFSDLRLNKRLSKQPWGWWFETPSWSLWRHCNGILCFEPFPVYQLKNPPSICHHAAADIYVLCYEPWMGHSHVSIMTGCHGNNALSNSLSVSILQRGAICSGDVACYRCPHYMELV